jgi:hypothetical protein
MPTPAYMLKFTGAADFTGANIRLYGDGVTKDVAIDLSKPPFSLSWKGFYPKNVVVDSADGPPCVVTLSGDNLLLVFNEPLPAVDFGNFPQPHVTMSIRFIYGTGI